ncbi:VOC family protein [Paenibacillus filicis]|uniref:VOC family protein n=1 Tax=Paenibacillus gyeongsangnamensis TaxID=3388067 RepID=A0ABT4QJG1_9BACL|nr:VOC family protein [Paenibacillus filicis]MCZ8516922.1 VOC family protein [Paenibacillus filicis]
MMQTSFGHLAIRVRDIEAAVQYYADNFGFTELFRMTDDNGNVGLVAIQIKDRQFLELIGNGTERLPANGSTAGFIHVCFETDDVDSLYKNLKEKGVYTDGEPRLGKSGSKFFFTRDLDGNSLEFVQILPGSLQDQAFQKFVK